MSRSTKRRIASHSFGSLRSERRSGNSASAHKTACASSIVPIRTGLAACSSRRSVSNIETGSRSVARR